MPNRHSITLTNRIRRVLGGGLLGLGAMLAVPAGAGDVNTKVAIEIPQQNLAGALASLAAQADLQILFSPELVASLQSTRLSGSYSGIEALQQLLTGSNLEYVVNGTDTVVIRARNASAQPTSHTMESPASASPAVASDEAERGRASRRSW